MIFWLSNLIRSKRRGIFIRGNKQNSRAFRKNLKLIIDPDKFIMDDKARIHLRSFDDHEFEKLYGKEL